MNKLYRSKTYLELHTSVVVKGKKLRIDFIHGQKVPVRRNGYFVTGDKDLQEALENDSAFGKSYVLEERNPETNKPNEPPDTGNEGGQGQNGGGGNTELDAITKVSDAKTYILNHKEIFGEITIDKLPNKKTILEFLESKKDVFPGFKNFK